MINNKQQTNRSVQAAAPMVARWQEDKSQIVPMQIEAVILNEEYLNFALLEKKKNTKKDWKTYVVDEKPVKYSLFRFCPEVFVSHKNVVGWVWRWMSTAETLARIQNAENWENPKEQRKRLVNMAIL